MAYETEVARGIALLDEKILGWRDRIDLGRLNIASCEDCILGQLYGDYFDGREILTGNIPPTEGFDWAVYRGFTTESPLDVDALTAAWRRALGGRAS